MLCNSCVPFCFQFFTQVLRFRHGVVKYSVSFLVLERPGAMTVVLVVFFERLDWQILLAEYLWRGRRNVSETARGMNRSPIRFPAVGRICRGPSAAFTSTHASFFVASARTLRGWGGPSVQRDCVYCLRTDSTLWTRRRWWHHAGVVCAPSAAVVFSSSDLAHHNRLLPAFVLKEPVLPVSGFLLFSPQIKQDRVDHGPKWAEDV